MTSATGQPFSCSIPNVQIEQERLEREKEERAKEETEEDIQNTIDRGLDLLEPLGNNCMRFYASVSFLFIMRKAIS
jgi:ribosomal protein L9